MQQEPQPIASPIARKPMRPDAMSSMDVIERATSLLSNLPPRAWFAFYGPGIPFVLCLLDFWSEMSRAPDAAHRVVPGALLLTLLYIAMKGGHALFGDILLSRLRLDPEPPPRLRPTQWIKLAASQAFIHSTMPWMMFLCSLPVFPLAWAYAFYRNAGVLACGHFRAHGSLASLLGRSLRAAHHAPRSNHAVLLTLSLVALLVWFNTMILTIMLPQLAGILTGIDFPMNHSVEAMFNTTLIATATATAWLIVSPIFHAAYAVRCFEADSTQSGEDLLSSLRALRLPSTTLATLAILTCLFFSSNNVSAEPPPATTPTTQQISELDRSLDHTLNRTEFRWRMPRETIPDDQMNWLERSMRDFSLWLQKTIKSIAQWISDFLRWLFEKDRKSSDSSSPSGGWLADPANARLILIFLLVALGVALAILLTRWFLSRRTTPTVQAASAPAIDLFDESILATDLPEDEWLRLAEEQLASGSPRLALRALFLGTLSRLGNHNLLAIAPGKTNGMYLRELQRRSQASPPLRSAFSLSVRLFERCWYGNHVPSPELIAEARTHHETISRDVTTVQA